MKTKEQEYLNFTSISAVKGCCMVKEMPVLFTADLSYNRSWLLGVSNIGIEEKHGVLSALTDADFGKPIRHFVQNNWQEAFMRSSPLEDLRTQINDPRLSWQKLGQDSLQLGTPYLIMSHKEKNLDLRFSIAWEPGRYIFNGQKPFTVDQDILRTTRGLMASADAAIAAFRDLSPLLNMELVLSPSPKELLRVKIGTIAYQFRKTNNAPSITSQKHTYRAKVSSWEEAAEWVRQRRKIQKETGMSHQI